MPQSMGKCCSAGYSCEMVRTLKRRGRHGGHGGHGVADRKAETVRAPEAGPDEQVERLAPDTPADLPKRWWGAVLKGTLKEYKKDDLKRLAELARAAGLNEPEMLADELHLLLEGARVRAQSVGPEGLGERLVRMGEALIAAHGSGKWRV